MLVIGTTISMTGCEHCQKLCQYNFDYVPLLQDNYCQSDLSCENFLREVSYRYLSGKIQSNPCIHENFQNDCSSFSTKICSELLKSSCNRGFLAPDPALKDVESLHDQLKRLDEESIEVEQELKKEIARQKQKYLRIINRLSELQIGM